jgi:hypothetical protein
VVRERKRRWGWRGEERRKKTKGKKKEEKKKENRKGELFSFLEIVIRFILTTLLLNKKCDSYMA